MTTVLDVLEEISKLEDPIKQSRAMLELYEALENGPWREGHERAAALVDGETEPADLSAEQLQEIRLEIETVKNRSAEEVEPFFGPMRSPGARRRGRRETI